MRILLAVDGSEYSNAATRTVLERPWPERSVVRVLSVAESFFPLPAPFLPETGTIYSNASDVLLSAARKVVWSTVSELEASRLLVESTVRQGDPRTEIVEEAKDWPAELVVVGSHGRTGISRWLLGSVSEHIVRHAPCSVQVCRLRLPSRT
jgi:nucleotide-binding universal stress UspA family protein